MFGLDISSYQKNIDLKKGKYDFCIVKATEGFGYKSPSFNMFVNELSKLDKLMGFYHFARPDLNKGYLGMIKEAQYFVSTLELSNLIGKGILVLDWETEPMDNQELVTAWLHEVKRLTGITSFIYGSSSKLTSWKEWKILNEFPVWVAQWPNLGYRPICGDAIKKTTSYDGKWKIWQYSDNGQYPQFDGGVDLNYTSMTHEEWISMATGMDNEYISPDMEWAIQNKLILGYGDGTYGPKDAVTREQLASILRRFDSMI